MNIDQVQSSVNTNKYLLICFSVLNNQTKRQKSNKLNKIQEFKYNQSTSQGSLFKFKRQSPMTYQSSLVSEQYEELLQLFSTHLNDTVHVINSVKKSICQILNIPLHSTDAFIQPNLPSVSVNCKKTLDDLKRISSILKGYSKSKNLQREEEQFRKSRIQNLSQSRQSASRKSKNETNSNHSSSLTIQKLKKPESGVKEDVDLVTAEGLQHSDDKNNSKLKNYSSLRNLHKISQQLNKESFESSKVPQQGSKPALSPYKSRMKRNQQSRKRARTEQGVQNRQILEIINQTQERFRQSMEKHDNSIDKIIKKNNECIKIVRDIHESLRRKREKKKRNNNHINSDLGVILQSHTHQIFGFQSPSAGNNSPPPNGSFNSNSLNQSLNRQNQSNQSKQAVKTNEPAQYKAMTPSNLKKI